MISYYTRLTRQAFPDGNLTGRRGDKHNNLLFLPMPMSHARMLKLDANSQPTRKRMNFMAIAASCVRPVIYMISYYKAIISCYQLLYKLL